jgi:hypothetical protein
MPGSMKLGVYSPLFVHPVLDIFRESPSLETYPSKIAASFPVLNMCVRSLLCAIYDAFARLQAWDGAVLRPPTLPNASEPYHKCLLHVFTTQPSHTTSQDSFGDFFGFLAPVQTNFGTCQGGHFSLIIFCWIPKTRV